VLVGCEVLKLIFMIRFGCFEAEFADATIGVCRLTWKP